MSNLKDYKCAQKAKESSSLCQERHCRHWLSCEKNMNCSIIASDEGPRTLQEIGDHFGISRERARQIENRLKEKIKDRLSPKVLDLTDQN